MRRGQPQDQRRSALAPHCPRLRRLEPPGEGDPAAARGPAAARHGGLCLRRPGHLTRVNDPRGLTTTYDYTGFNELKTLTSPDTGVTRAAAAAARAGSEIK